MAFEHRFDWMPPNAPYAPIALAGLLHAIGEDGTVAWQFENGPAMAPVPVLSCDLELPDLAAKLLEAPWPDLSSLDSELTKAQAIKPVLRKREDPIAEWWRLLGYDPDRSEDAAHPSIEQEFLSALLSDAVRDGDGLPGRNRLLRGVKSDLSGARDHAVVTKSLSADHLTEELTAGPRNVSGSTGRGLGLVPGMQTFGATTGREPSSVNAYSPLLYLLCWLGILAMPPIGVAGRSSRRIGAPLFSNRDTLSWPVWTPHFGLTELVPLYGLAAIHEEQPDTSILRTRGIEAVFRSRAKSISSMVDVFGWGVRVA